MLNKLQKNKRYVVLKDGNNYGLMIGLLLIASICVLLFTSKMWLPDSRPNLSSRIDSSMFFTLNEVKVKNYSVDYDTNIGEVLIAQKKSSEKGKYDLSYKVYDDKGNELPFFIINGNEIKENEDSVMMYQDTLIQFGVYEDIYYVKVDISQKDTTTQSIYIDYRNFKHKKVLEKGKDYLVNLDTEKEVKQQLEKQLKPFEEKAKLLNDEVKFIEKLKGKEKQDKKNRLDEIKLELQQLKNEMQPLKEDIENQTKKIKELE